VPPFFFLVIVRVWENLFSLRVALNVSVRKVRFTLSSELFGESDSKAGFCHDLEVLFSLMYIFFFVFVVLSGLLFSTSIAIFSVVFLSLSMFLNLQGFVEVKVPRYGWKCSRLDYKLASAFLLMEVLFVPIVNNVMYSGIITRLPTDLSVILFFCSIGFLVIPFILGIIFALLCYLDFASSLGISAWRRDREIIEAISKYSFFYRNVFRRKR